MAKIWQGYGKMILNKWEIFIKYLAKFCLTINDPLLVLPGNEQDLDHENIVNTYLFHQVCKVHDLICFREQYSSIPMQRSHDTLALDISP